MLVQRFAGTDAEKKAPMHQCRRSRCGLRDDRRVDPPDRTGHARSNTQPFGRIGDRADDAPDEGRLTLPLDPGWKWSQMRAKSNLTSSARRAFCASS
jgi:hypothetical protein